MNENEPMDPANLIALLSNPEVLRAYGYQITPKGCMSLIFMRDLEMTDEEAEALAQKVEDLIFLSGYIYVHESKLQLGDPSDG